MLGDDPQAALSFLFRKSIEKMTAVPNVRLALHVPTCNSHLENHTHIIERTLTRVFGLAFVFYLLCHIFDSTADCILSRDHCPITFCLSAFHIWYLVPCFINSFLFILYYCIFFFIVVSSFPFPCELQKATRLSHDNNQTNGLGDTTKSKTPNHNIPHTPYLIVCMYKVAPICLSCFQYIFIYIPEITTL